VTPLPDHSHLCLLKCHLIFLSYGSGLTSMQHTTLQKLLYNIPFTINDISLLVNTGTWYQLSEFIPSNSNSCPDSYIFHHEKLMRNFLNISGTIHLTLFTTSFPSKLIIVLIFAADLTISNLVTVMTKGILLIACCLILIIFVNLILCFYHDLTNLLIDEHLFFVFIVNWCVLSSF